MQNRSVFSGAGGFNSSAEGGIEAGGRSKETSTKGSFSCTVVVMSSGASEQNVGDVAVAIDV